MSSVSHPAMSLSPQLFDDAVGAPPDLRTLVDIARFRALVTPDLLAYTFLTDGETAEANLSFQQLDIRARSIAARLQERGGEGQRVLLVFDPGLDYVAAILGCFYAGAIAVPVYPPDPFRLARTLPRLRAVVNNAEAGLLLSTREVLGEPGSGLWEICGDGTLPLETIPLEQAGDWRPLSSDPRRVALLQYTSGSTGDARGVTLTHANLMHNFQALYGLIHVPGAVGVHWLPPYHDMGLIGGILLPFYAGRRTVLMSPLSFMQKPLRWLEAIHRYRGTTTGGPNFAYELCVRKIKPEECEGLDLSCWQVAVNGAEPVRPDTLSRFAEKFAPFGFRAEAHMPAYGMAETTLIISAAPIAKKPTVRSFHAQALEANVVQPVRADHPQARRIVSCGVLAQDTEVRIVDPETLRALKPGHVGEIWLRSPSIGQGYWNRPEETERVFRAALPDHALPDDTGGEYLRTGDLGFLDEDELYVVGRLKELIILGGRNFYPHDIERAVQEVHPALKQDGGAAFSVEVNDEEQLVLVLEVVRPRRYDLDEVLTAVRRALAEQFDLAAHAVLLIPSGSLPKTSSGKTRRRQCRDDFLAGRLNVLRAWQANPSEGRAGGGPTAFDPPNTRTERRLAELWRALLGLEQVDRRADFFGLGAQSLRVAQLLTRISAEFGVEVPMRRLFDQPTLAGMAEAIDEALTTAAEGNGHAPRADASPIPRTEGAGPHPLSFSQQRLWFLEQIGDNGPAAHVPVTLRLAGPVDARALEAALHDLGKRHEMLRARFFEQDGLPMQEIVPHAPVALERHDLSGRPDAEPSPAAKQLQAAWIAQPFDLAQAPLWRAALMTLSEQEHELLLALHHLICDGWSLDVLLRDLETAYTARRRGQAPEWREAPARYVDYVRWRQDGRSEERQQAELAWWRRRLEGAPQTLELPADRPRTTETSPQPASLSRRLPPALRIAMEQLARTKGATPFMVHLAAFQTLLARYTGRDDLCVGTAVAGRLRAEWENTVGCFINTVALRGDLSGDPAFAELLGRTREAVLEDLQHADAPFEKVVEAVQPQRRPGAAPLVQAMFLFQTPLDTARALGEAKIVAAGSDYSGLTVFDLSLVLEPRGEELEASLVYDERQFDAATIEAMIDAYLAALEQIAADPATRLTDLPIPAPRERQLLVEDWNATKRDLPPVTGFHELFELQAKQRPEAPAIEFGASVWTYRELNDRAERIARALRGCGVGVDTPVGVHLSRSPELVATLLGIAKAGGAYVPLDPDYPAARLELMIRDCAMPALISETALAARLPESSVRIFLLEELTAEKASEHETVSSEGTDAAGRDGGHANPLAGEDRLAYIIYTSGSTGTPKGVMVPQRAVVNFLASMAEAPGLSADDTMLAVTTVSFDIAVLELFLPLTVGAKIVLADRQTATEGTALAELIAERGVNAMQATPATYRMLLTAGWRPRPGMKLLVGGEALTGDLAAQLLAAQSEPRSQVELWNMYGPTETTVWSTIHRVTHADDPISIGRPIGNTQVYVVDPYGKLVPRGAAGELWIGGAGVARGYWGRPELTGERFVADRFSRSMNHEGSSLSAGAGANGNGKPDAGHAAPPHGTALYKTGDLVRWRRDGMLEFLGRADTQVKIRGFRIELGEIEAALTAHPQVKEAAVTAPADATGERRLVAYYAARETDATGAASKIAADELRRFLGQSLAPHMIPTAFVPLPALPHTPAGKIDRRALPAPEGEAFAVSAPYVAPRTPLEEEIAAAWREVLGVERVGVEDSFFELGGHSLLAARLFSRLRDRLQIDLPLREFYQRPTVAAIAEAIVRVRAQHDEDQGLRTLLERLDAMTEEEAAAFLRETDNAT